jgi:hypothetical protein
VLPVKYELGFYIPKDGVLHFQLCSRAVCSLRGKRSVSDSHRATRLHRRCFGPGRVSAVRRNAGYWCHSERLYTCYIRQNWAIKEKLRQRVRV